MTIINEGMIGEQDNIAVTVNLLQRDKYVCIGRRSGESEVKPARSSDLSGLGKNGLPGGRTTFRIISDRHVPGERNICQIGILAKEIPLSLCSRNWELVLAPP